MLLKWNYSCTIWSVEIGIKCNLMLWWSTGGLTRCCPRPLVIGLWRFGARTLPDQEDSSALTVWTLTVHWTTFFDNERVELVAFGGWFLTALNITARAWWISIHCTGPFMWRPKYRWEEPAARNVTMKNEKTHWPASQPAFGSHSIWFQCLGYCIQGFHEELLLCWYWVAVCCCHEGVWHFQLTLWWIYGFMLVDENPEKSVCKRQH